MVRKNNVLASLLEKHEERKRYSELLYKAVDDVLDEILRICPEDQEFLNGKYKIELRKANIAHEYMLTKQSATEYGDYYVVSFFGEPIHHRVDDFLYGDFHCRYTKADMKDWVVLANDLSAILKEIESEIDEQTESMKQFIEKYQ